MRLFYALMAWVTFNIYAVDFSVTTLNHDIEYVDGMEVGNFVAGDGPDIVVIGRNAQREKQMQIMALKDGKLLADKSFLLAVDQQVLSYQVAQLANKPHKVMLFFMADQIAYFEVATKSYKTLLKTQSIYRNSHALTSRLGKFDFVFDINNDGLSDFIIADFEQTYIYIQQSDGSFAEKQTIEMLAQRRLFFNSNAVYSGADLQINDFNGDGDNDIVYRIDNDLYVFTQQQGQFNPKAMVKSLRFKHPLDNHYDQFGEDQSNLTTHTFFDMKDLNQDGRLDIVTQMTKSSGLLEKSSSYQVYFGQAADNGDTTFLPEPSAKINSKGMQFELQLLDFNGDGDLDIVSPSFELGVGSIIASLFSSSADLDIAFHPMMNGKNYHSKPITEKEITVDFDLSSGQQVYPLLILADFNGDGSKDLLTGHNGKKLYLRPAHTGKRVFARRAEKFNIKLPKDGRLISTGKFNDDNKTDLLIRYDRLDGKELSSQIKVLVTR